MRVSELKEGMLVRPKRGMVFRKYTSGYATQHRPEPYSQLECHKRSSPYPKLATAPVVYLGKAPKTTGTDGDPTGPSPYESRHYVYVTSIGQRLRVAPEAWRNMEAVDNG
jgi:hypothetical protein